MRTVLKATGVQLLFKGINERRSRTPKSNGAAPFQQIDLNSLSQKLLFDESD